MAPPMTTIGEIACCGYTSLEGLCGRPRSWQGHNNPAIQAMTPERHRYTAGVWRSDQLELEALERQDPLPLFDGAA